MSSPSSKRCSNSCAVIVDCFFILSCPSYGYDSSSICSIGENGRPKLPAEFRYETDSWFIRKACHKLDPLWVDPERFRLIKIDPMLRLIGITFWFVIFKLHLGIIPIPLGVSMIRFLPNAQCLTFGDSYQYNDPLGCKIKKMLGNGWTSFYTIHINVAFCSYF